MGSGWSSTGTMFTLNTTEQHSVLTMFSCPGEQPIKAVDGTKE